jgi:hypothetical protein
VSRLNRAEKTLQTSVGIGVTIREIYLILNLAKIVTETQTVVVLEFAYHQTVPPVLNSETIAFPSLACLRGVHTGFHASVEHRVWFDVVYDVEGKEASVVPVTDAEKEPLCRWTV